ncbi:MAG TPA: ABC transporter ATP-binding protein [Firmicutes bacterium]|jgi:ABC-2 type transport system ATP-binding protein|nr:ABC transporter ATP-binding protein [Bacillota bacterium]HCX78007.1 ABC transporter ATP-binding protein [Bacillota bacterium]
MSVALRVNDLYKVYNNGKKNVTALNNISFEIPQKSICGLLGSNGAGKTTLIKCTVGLLEPTGGNIFVGETDITQNATERLKHVSAVLEGGRNLFWYMTVKENMRYFSLLRGQNAGDNKTYNRDILEYLGIGDIYNRRVQFLSFGMRQRASIAVALACRSDVIFMDEPTTGLDISYQEELAQLILKLRDVYDCTVILSSHDMHFVNGVCSDCVLINKGELVHSGKINEFKNAFEIDNYIISCREPLADKQLFFLENHIIIRQYDDEKQNLEVLWNHTDNLYKLASILHECGIDVSRVDKMSGLASAVSSITKRQVEKGETDPSVSV